MKFRFYIGETGVVERVAAAVDEVAEAAAENDREFHGHPLAGPMHDDDLRDAFNAYTLVLFEAPTWHDPVAGYLGVHATVLVVRAPGGACSIYYEGRTAAFEASIREALGEDCPGSVPGLVEALRAAGLTNQESLDLAAMYYDGEAIANAAAAGGADKPWQRDFETHAAAARVAARWADSGNLSRIAAMCWEARHVLRDWEPGAIPLRKAWRELESWPQAARDALARAIGIPEDWDDGGRKWVLLTDPVKRPSGVVF